MSIFKRPGSPIWQVRLGRKARQSTGTTDRREAEEFEEQLRQRLWRLNKLGDRGAVVWKDAAARWLNDSARPRVRDREILQWLAPRLDNEAVSSIDPDALEQLRQHAKQDGWSHSTTDRMMNTIGAVLRACVRWRMIDYSPPMPKYRTPAPEAPWVSREQFEALCAELPEHLELAARFAAYTMLRMRAMGQLTWDRVDFTAKTAWIPARHQKAGRRFVFPLSPDTLEVLKRLRALNPVGRVFQYEGKPIDNFNTKAFKKAVERAKVGPLHWHSLRHTGASWAAQAGVPLNQIMELGDWKSYSMVLRYSHLAPAHLAAAAELVSHMSHTTRKAA